MPAQRDPSGPRHPPHTDTRGATRSLLDKPRRRTNTRITKRVWVRVRGAGPRRDRFDTCTMARRGGPRYFGRATTRYDVQTGAPGLPH